MRDKNIIGWDVGGAHLKMACLDSDNRTVTRQVATPLWQGLATLEQALDSVAEVFADGPGMHFITMTGELVDFFADRKQGVEQIIGYLGERLQPGSNTWVYAGKSGLVRPDQASAFYADIASANWHATASCVAQSVASGFLVDVGSTTTDIIPFSGGRVASRGYTDQQRLQSGELVYTGITRTPVMAITRRARFRGRWQSLAAEYFATMADVYRLTGELDEAVDLLPAADNGAKTISASARRLARMFGTDLGEYPGVGDWVRAAEGVASRQLALLDNAFNTLTARNSTIDKTLVATGSGRFVVEKLAKNNNCRIIDFDRIPGFNTHSGPAHNCATAVALTRLFRNGPGV